MSIQGQRGVCPIGGVIGWLKTTTNVPTLATQGREEWEELNGQTISDVESPMNGQTLPDGIGTTDANRRFLRFNATSGGTGGTCCHCHVPVICCFSFGYVSVCSGPGCALCCISCGYGYTDQVAHLSPYLDLVPIVRVK